MIAVGISDRSGQRRSFSAARGQRLLQAGLAAGIGLPHECATGTCGNCKATVVSGEVVKLWPGAPGAKVCRNQNETLLCQSTAEEAVELSLKGDFTQPCAPACRLIEGEIHAVRSLTPEISEFSVKLCEPIAYKPGQFILLSGLDIEGPRAYSMTRHDPGSTELNLLVRRDAKGSFSKALFADLSRVHPVSVFGPLGRAVFSCDEARPFFAIAGGSGIAGILSILHHAKENSHFSKHPSHLVFGLRDSESAYLLDELAAGAEEASGGLEITVAFSDASCPPELAARYPALKFLTGFAHDVAREILAVRTDKTNPIFFVAGPPVMVNATMRMLIAGCKVSPAEIRYDRFG